jgi:dolichol-phosphate mannosyltransferase
VTRLGLVERWIKFHAVGAAGVFVQLASLGLLHRLAGWNYLTATAVAVELAVLHNFFWHETWTWRDRRSAGWRTLAVRLVRFNLSAGLLSIASNLVLMRLLVGRLGLHYLAANALAIAATGLINFLVSETLIFRAAHRRA